jgi:hypothetical protein
MLPLIATLQAFIAGQADRLRVDDSGSETIEKVLWAVAVIAIVGIVVAAIQGFVTSEAAKIK